MADESPNAERGMRLTEMLAKAGMAGETITLSADDALWLAATQISHMTMVGVLGAANAHALVAMKARAETHELMEAIDPRMPLAVEKVMFPEAKVHH